MKRLLILDTETGVIEPDKGQMLEIGASYYVVGAGMIAQFSAILPTAPGTVNEAEKINGITAAMLDAGRDADIFALTVMKHFIDKADCLIAHNAEFDRGWLAPYPMFETKPWACTCEDFVWDEHISSRSAVSIALAHGVPVVSAHRALTDCQLIAAVFDKLGDKLPAMIVQAMRPKALFQSLVSYDDRELAKKQFFHWEPETKRWLRRMAIEDATKEKLGFDVRKVDK